MRRFFAIIVLLAAVLLGGCGMSDLREVSGTVDRISHEHGTMSLQGDQTVYYCWAEGCSLVEKGDRVTISVGHDNAYNWDDVVVEITRTP